MPGRTILVIDYDPQSVESTRKALLEAGYRVEVATDGVEGLKAFERTRPDLVLIEPMVPKKHGFQVCREIKGSSRGPTVPVLITTGFYKGRKHKATAREHYGCDDYLEKPIAQEDLLAACRRWVDERSGGAGIPAVPVERRDAEPMALDDLTDDEIVARLDAMIDAATAVETPGPVPPPPEPVVARDVMAASAAPAEAPATGIPAPRPSPKPKPAAAAPAAARPAPKVTPPPQSPVARTVPAESRARSAQTSALESGTTRAVVAPRAEAEGPRHRPVLYVVVALVLAGAAVLTWTLTRPVVTDGLPEIDRTVDSTSAPSDMPVDRAHEPTPPEAWRAPDEPDRPADETVESASMEEPPGDEPEVTSTAPMQPTGTASASADAVRDAPPRPAPARAPAAEVPAAAASTAPAEPETVDADLAEPPAAPAEMLPVESPSPEPEPSSTPAVERGALVPLSEVDDAPVPIRKSAPKYPAMARNLRLQGTVTLRLLVDETGRVEEAEVLRGIDGRVLDDAARRAALGWSYRPATVGGVAVKVWITEQVVFRL